LLPVVAVVAVTKRLLAEVAQVGCFKDLPVLFREFPTM
jgi:hypothetical protein